MTTEQETWKRMWNTAYFTKECDFSAEEIAVSKISNLKFLKHSCPHCGQEIYLVNKDEGRTDRRRISIHYIGASLNLLSLEVLSRQTKS